MYCILDDVGLFSKTNPTMAIDKMKIMIANKEQHEILIHIKPHTSIKYYNCNIF